MKPILDVCGLRYINKCQGWDFILRYGTKSYKQARKWGELYATKANMER